MAELTGHLARAAHVLRLESRVWKADTPRAVVEAIGPVPPGDAGPRAALDGLHPRILARVLDKAGRRLIVLASELDNDAPGLREAVSRFVRAGSTPLLKRQTSRSLLNCWVYFHLRFGTPL